MRSTTLCEFIASLGSPVRGFPPTLRQLYAELLSELRDDPAAEGFDEIPRNQSLQEPSLRGAARRLHLWFPTHFFKFQDALLRSEQSCKKHGQALLLDRPKVVFVDLGCGAGAASAAVLATLEQYQFFNRLRSARIDPVEVHLVALDPAEPELAIYNSLIGRYASRIEEQRITASYTTLCQSFPEGLDSVLAALGSLRGHVLIVGMSNLLRWIWGEYDEHWTIDGLDYVPELRSIEVDALGRLARDADFDCLAVIGVETKSGKPGFLRDKLSWFLHSVRALLKLSGRRLRRHYGVRCSVVFENPEGSHWVSQRQTASPDFYVESYSDCAPAYVRDGRLSKVLSSESLEAAWAKVRSHMRYESLTDQVELKLFEEALDLNLARLRAGCLERCYACLNVDHAWAYEHPKSEQSTRPRMLARFEDQIIGAAVAVGFTPELAGSRPEVSYAHRLSQPRTEFLYEYWFRAYQRYLSDVLSHLGDNYVCVTDIETYYVCIPQAKLQAILSDRLSDSARCCELLAATIQRDCRSPHRAGYGLPQGHAVSGLLANVILQPMDERMMLHHGMQGRYFRFADDMTVTKSTGAVEGIVDLVQCELSGLDRELRLNKGKTFWGTQWEYRRRVASSRELNETAHRFHALLLPLFLLNLPYRREFRRTGWVFACTYQHLLDGLGINFSPEWVFRKLDDYARPWRRLQARKRRWRLHWPPLTMLRGAAGQLQWRQGFRSHNELWLCERDAIRGKLSSMLRGAAEELLGEPQSEDQWRRRRRRLRFSLYRLSVLGVEGTAPHLVRLLLSQPWSIRSGLTCMALAAAAEGAALAEVHQRSGSTYVRAMALRALGATRDAQYTSILASVLDGEASPIERLMASEGLLGANLWQDISFERMRLWLEREANEPYVQKNIILLLAQAYPDTSRALLEQVDAERPHSIVHRAVHYALTKPPWENLLSKAEPEALRKYRARSYPIIEQLLGDLESYALVSS